MLQTIHHWMEPSITANKRQKTLRQFCLEHGHDPSNWSKIERDVNPPPKDPDTLATWAKQLGLKRDSGAWQDFMDQADIIRGQIPMEVMSDEKLLAKLPAFFRSVRGAELTESQLGSLIEKIRESNTAGPRRHLVSRIIQIEKGGKHGVV